MILLKEVCSDQQNHQNFAKDELLLDFHHEVSASKTLRFIHFDTFRKHIRKCSMSYSLPDTLLRDFENGELIGKSVGKFGSWDVVRQNSFRMSASLGDSAKQSLMW